MRITFGERFEAASAAAFADSVPAAEYKNCLLLLLCYKESISW